MRRALDYLVYEIAFLDSGIEQDDTQFPVDQSPRRFWARRERNSRGLDDHSCYLVGVSNEHAGALQRDQPYSGASWTERLARLSNPDKHRHLTVTQHQTKMRVARYVNATDEVIKRDGDAISVVFGADENVHMKFLVTASVAFEDGSKVIETLQQLQPEVAGVLGEFEARFKGQCHH